LKSIVQVAAQAELSTSARSTVTCSRRWAALCSARAVAGMPDRKPQPGPPTWNIYKFARRREWLGTVEAPADGDRKRSPEIYDAGKQARRDPARIAPVGEDGGGQCGLGENGKHLLPQRNIGYWKYSRTERPGSSGPPAVRGSPIQAKDAMGDVAFSARERDTTPILGPWSLP
jgi:hypothetical protein